MAKREPYAIVGAATRAAVDRAMRCPELVPFDHRVLLAVISALSTWSRLEDRVGVRELADVVYGVVGASGWQRRKVSNALLRLRAASVIRYEPSSGTVGARALIGLPRVSLATLSDPQGCPDRGTLGCPDPRGTVSDAGRDGVSTSRPLREESSEKASESCARVGDDALRLAEWAGMTPADAESLIDELCRIHNADRRTVVDQAIGRAIEACTDSPKIPARYIAVCVANAVKGPHQVRRVTLFDPHEAAVMRTPPDEDTHDHTHSPHRGGVPA